MRILHPLKNLANQFRLLFSQVVTLLWILMQIIQLDRATIFSMSKPFARADGLVAIVFPVEVLVLYLVGSLAQECR